MKGPVPLKKRKINFDAPDYRRLVENLRQIIDEAAAKGIDLRKRQDLLVCQACGAYENVLAEGQQVVCEAAGKIISNKEFILIDCKERVTYRKNITYCKMTYEFVCPICGAQQRAVIRDCFEN